MSNSLESIVLLGTAYSGSTALGMALHSSKNKITYVGELSRIPGMFEKYQLDREVGTCSACLINQEDCKIYTDQLFKKLQQKKPAEVHKYLIRHLKTKTIVDASKHPAWLRLLAQATPIDQIRVIITVKNPKYYVQSCLDRDIDSAWLAANAWRDTYYDTLRTLNRLGIAYYVVRNEDFLLNKLQVIRNIENFLGLHYKLESQSKPIHAIGGNPAARVEEFGRQKILQSAKRLGRQVFDFNHQKTHSNSRQKITFDTQVLFDTPGLSDMANLLGYTVGDIV